MLNILIPMAGLGSRFAKEGFTDPKPLIPIHGIPMIRWVISNLSPEIDHRFIFVCQRQHVQDYSLREKFNLWAPGSQIVEIDTVTDGAARTCLSAIDLIDNNDNLLIANSDQFIDADISEFINYSNHSNSIGSIMTMEADDPKWSYVKIGKNGCVSKVVEKQVISKHATTGLYFFRHGTSFVNAALQMIDNKDLSNGEYYVAPVYNYLINDGASISSWSIGTEADGMHGLGIPEDLEKFINNPLSISAFSRVSL